MSAQLQPMRHSPAVARGARTTHCSSYQDVALEVSNEDETRVAFGSGALPEAPRAARVHRWELQPEPQWCADNAAKCEKLKTIDLSDVLFEKKAANMGSEADNDFVRTPG